MSGYWLLEVEFKDIKIVVIDSQIYIYIYNIQTQENILKYHSKLL